MRIWDVFFHEGPKILFRVALACLKLKEKEMLRAGDELAIILQDLPNDESLTADAVMKCAIKTIDLSKKELEKVRDQLRKKRGGEEKS